MHIIGFNLTNIGSYLGSSPAGSGCLVLFGLIYSWQWHGDSYKRIKKFLIINDWTYHGGKCTDIKMFREEQWRKKKHWMRDHHNLSTADRMSVDDDSDFTYRKLLSTRSAIPSWPSASVSRHCACLKHISLALTVVTGLSPRIVANFWLADSCFSL